MKGTAGYDNEVSLTLFRYKGHRDLELNTDEMVVAGIFSCGGPISFDFCRSRGHLVSPFWKTMDSCTSGMSLVYLYEFSEDKCRKCKVSSATYMAVGTIYTRGVKLTYQSKQLIIRSKTSMFSAYLLILETRGAPEKRQITCRWHRKRAFMPGQLS